jgi:hypothetical protein
MFAGFITPKHAIKSIGIHQRLDTAAYRAIKPFLSPGSFPRIDQVLHFEGYHGPDGLKVKSRDERGPGHMYDPISETGDVPSHIENHYRQLVGALSRKDMIRAAFEAGWLAHFVTDGLTPAHHFPLHDKLAALSGDPCHRPDRSRRRQLREEAPNIGFWRRNWAIWGAKGLHSTHQNFELGIATALLLQPIRATLNLAKLAEARRIGPVEFFKLSALEVAQLDLYQRFYRRGWTADLGRIIKRQLAPQTAGVIGIIWLLAYLEAGQMDLAGQPFLTSPVLT